jgi:hypothetical protein
MTRRRFPAWLALFAMALQALWPLAAQPAPTHSVQICTTGGATYEVELPGAPAQPSHEHCVLCVLGVDRPMAAPAAPAGLAVALAGDASAQPRRAAFVASDPAFSARPRAPPARS